MRRIAAALAMTVLLIGSAHGQGLVGDILAGKLVSPEVGTWAWYDLTDATTGQSFVMRIAIVGEKKVRRKDGFWLELEVVPLVGYRSVYKMLLTGPASDPKNIHKVLQRSGREEVQELPVDQEPVEAPEEEKPPERKLLGEEELSTVGGPVRTEHYALVEADRKIEVWLNEKVCPTGLVRMKSPEGELMLRNYGKGGPEARSVINDPPVPGANDVDLDVRVDVQVERNPKPKSEEGEAP